MSSRVGWQELVEFAGVDIDRSFALSWSLERGALLLDADIQLRPEHPFYEPPRRRERACIRPAIIEFPYVTRMRHDGRDAGDGLPSMVARLRGGAIANLERYDDGPYVIEGAFGRVEIDAERPLLRLQDP